MLTVRSAWFFFFCIDVSDTHLGYHDLMATVGTIGGTWRMKCWYSAFGKHFVCSDRERLNS